MRHVLHAAVGLLVLLTASCTSGRVTSIWSEPGGSRAGYHKLIVFGITNSPKVRRAYEDNFVTALAGVGVRATPGHELVPDAELKNRASVARAMNAAHADGILVTHLVPEKNGQAQPPLRIADVPRPYRRVDHYFSQVYEDVCAPDYYSGYQALRLETNLYDAKDKRLLWSGRSLPLDPESEQTTISQVIADVMTQISLDGYFPRPSVKSSQIAQ